MSIDEQLDAACDEMTEHVKACTTCRDGEGWCPFGDRKISEINEMEVERFNDARDREAEESGYGK